MSLGGSLSKNSGSKLGGGLFGRKLGANQNQGPVDPFVQRVDNIVNAYTPTSENYKFSTVVYSSEAGKSMGGGTMGKGSLGAKQHAFSPEEWESYVALAPPDMAPTVLQGFSGLSSRMVEQQNTLMLMEKKLANQKQAIQSIKSSYNIIRAVTIQKAIELNRKIQEITMEILRDKEVQALNRVPFSKDEQELLDKLEQLKSDSAKPNKYVSQINKIKNLKSLADDSVSTSSDETISDIEDVAEILEEVGKSLSALQQSIESMSKSIKVQEFVVDGKNDDEKDDEKKI